MTLTKGDQICVDACNSCAKMCRECAKACDGMGGMEKCSKVCLECALACEQHSLHLAKGDHSMAEACIAACETCTTEAGKGADQMEVCQECARASRKCALACRKAERVKA